MSIWARLYSGNPGLDFRRAWSRALVVSLVLVAICSASLLLRGLNLGIDFDGGGVWEVPSQTLGADEARDSLGPVGHGDARIQVLTASGSRIVRVQTGVDGVDDSDAIVKALAEAAGIEESEVSINTVGPYWGDEITSAAERALIYFFLAVAAFIAIRLEWKMALGAMVAVLHDIVISVGVYSIFQFEVTPATVIAFLTILGYSLYDTVVVFDKVAESAPLAGTARKMTYTDVANYATNEVLMRSVNTTVTSLLPVISLLVVGSVLMGATTLREFAVALVVGLTIGAYSSIFVAVPLLIWMKEREHGYAEIRNRLGGHGGAERLAELAAARATSGGRPGTAVQSEAPALGHPPRPRKKGRKR